MNNGRTQLLSSDSILSNQSFISHTNGDKKLLYLQSTQANSTFFINNSAFLKCRHDKHGETTTPPSSPLVSKSPMWYPVSRTPRQSLSCKAHLVVSQSSIAETSATRARPLYPLSFVNSLCSQSLYVKRPALNGPVERLRR